MRKAAESQNNQIKMSKNAPVKPITREILRAYYEQYPPPPLEEDFLALMHEMDQLIEALTPFGIFQYC